MPRAGPPIRKADMTHKIKIAGVEAELSTEELRKLLAEIQEVLGSPPPVYIERIPSPIPYYIPDYGTPLPWWQSPITRSTKG